jgi:hypothetical protein
MESRIPSPENERYYNPNKLHKFMSENIESATEKSYMNICDWVVAQAVERIKVGATFADNEMDLLLHISSVDTDRIADRLDESEKLRFLGLLRDRQEAIAARFQEACRYGG